jgi:hypothetical protein
MPWAAKSWPQSSSTSGMDQPRATTGLASRIFVHAACPVEGSYPSSCTSKVTLRPLTGLASSQLWTVVTSCCHPIGNGAAPVSGRCIPTRIVLPSSVVERS